MSRFVWGTVTAVSPLRVQLDGDTAEIPYTPDSLVDPLTLAVDDRVRCEMSKLLIVVGKSGGVIVSDAPREYPWSTVSSVAAGAELEISVTLPESAAIVRFVSSVGTRSRLYDRAAKSTADASRASGVYPSGDSGLLFEADGATSAEDFALPVKAIIVNRDGGTAYKLRVKNLSAAGAVITGSFWVVF